MVPILLLPKLPIPLNFIPSHGIVNVITLPGCRTLFTGAVSALCFSMAVPAYADHYQTPKSIKGVLINEHAQIPDVLEVGASQVVLNNALKDTDYGIAWHAYPETFEDPVFSDDQYVQEKADTYIINLKSLHILTDYMQKADMLSPAGKVRHLILSEQGLLSAHYAFGLIDVNGNKKPSFEVYKNLQ